LIYWSAHIAVLFNEQPILSRFGAAASAGFSAVDMWSPFEHSDEAIADAVGRSGIRLTSFNLPAGDMGAGKRGFLNLPHQRERVVRDMRRARQLALRVGAQHVNALVGNLPPGVDFGDSLEAAAETLRRCADIVESDDITILIEPLNALENPKYLLKDADEAAAFVESVGRPNVRLLYDAYHAAKAGRDWATDLRTHGGLVRHVHYADAPGRHEPGTGTTDIRSLIGLLDSIAYSGAIGLEYRPIGDSIGSLAWLPVELRGQDARKLLDEAP
jgi:hydroxypyruvate isomerase